MSRPADVFWQLVRLETELWNDLDGRLRAAHGLPLAWFEPMQVIDARENCRVQDIADALAITVGGTSKLVDRLERSGLCRRRPNPGDRRSSILELTDEGRRALSDATATYEAELEARLTAVLSAERLDKLLAALTELRSGRGRSR